MNTIYYTTKDSETGIVAVNEYRLAGTVAQFQGEHAEEMAAAAVNALCKSPEPQATEPARDFDAEIRQAAENPTDTETQIWNRQTIDGKDVYVLQEAEPVILSPIATLPEWPLPSDSTESTGETA